MVTKYPWYHPKRWLLKFGIIKPQVSYRYVFVAKMDPKTKFRIISRDEQL